MPLQIGENQYRLCGLDTNIYSELVKDPPTYFAGLRRVLGSDFLLCFSPYSLFELRAKPEVYHRFVEIFDTFPCAILKNEQQLFEEEKKHHPEPADVDPMLFGFSFVNRSRGTNLRNLLPQVFENAETQERERSWPGLKMELLSNWMELKKNYPPKGRAYQLPEAAEFARKATVQQIAFRAPEWARVTRASGEPVRWQAFPSVIMTMLTVFFRLYEPRGRKPVPQDVFDVLISTPTPYLDVVVTENMQANVLSKAKKIFPQIRDVEVYALRDLRQAPVT